MKIILRAMLIEIIFNAIFIAVIYYLWNTLMPEIIMAKEITLVQALTLRILVQCCMGIINHDKK
jgi:hypothetical protein